MSIKATKVLYFLITAFKSLISQKTILFLIRNTYCNKKTYVQLYNKFVVVTHMFFSFNSSLDLIKSGYFHLISEFLKKHIISSFLSEWKEKFFFLLSFFQVNWIQYYYIEHYERDSN